MRWLERHSSQPGPFVPPRRGNRSLPVPRPSASRVSRRSIKRQNSQDQDRQADHGRNQGRDALRASGNVESESFDHQQNAHQQRDRRHVHRQFIVNGRLLHDGKGCDRNGIDSSMHLAITQRITSRIVESSTALGQAGQIRSTRCSRTAPSDSLFAYHYTTTVDS